MKIGLDLDDTVCKTSESLNKWAKKYATIKKMEVADIFMDFSLRKRFLKEHFIDIIKEAELKNDFKEVFTKLSLDNDIYIITARSDVYMPDGKKVDYITLEWLADNDILYKKYYSHVYKEEKAMICEENKIDIMIDDDIANYEALVEKGINVFLFDDKNMYPEVKNRVTSWKDIEELLLG